MDIEFAGECGAGKSFLINLIIGRDVAKTICTMGVQLYQGGYNLELWDTPGLDKGSTTHHDNRSSEALVKVKSLICLKDEGEMYFLAYGMQGSTAKAARLKHYGITRDLLSPAVPIVAIITRLERYQDHLQGWLSDNAQEPANYRMNFVDHICITTVPDCHKPPASFR